MRYLLTNIYFWILVILTAYTLWDNRRSEQQAYLPKEKKELVDKEALHAVLQAQSDFYQNSQTTETSYMAAPPAATLRCGYRGVFSYKIYRVDEDFQRIAIDDNAHKAELLFNTQYVPEQIIHALRDMRVLDTREIGLPYQAIEGYTPFNQHHIAPTTLLSIDFTLISMEKPIKTIEQNGKDPHCPK